MIMPVHPLVSASIGSIVVATDESSDSAALHTAGALASATAGRLHVVHAVARDEQRVEPSTMHELDHLLSAQLPDGPTVSTRTITAQPAHAVAEIAAQHWADLIVLGPSDGQKSLAERVFQSASCACLIVNRPLELPLQRVLVALDLADHYCGALDEGMHWCTLLGDQNGTRLILLHVVRKSGELDEEAERERLDAALEQEHKRLHPAEWINVVRRVACRSDVADAIMDAARREQAQLIVVGSNARGRVNRALFGSVATTVTRNAETPVLLVPPALCEE